MISKNEILKMASDVLHRSGGGGRVKRSVVRPKREWFIGIGLFFVVLIVGGVYTAGRYAYFSTLESTIGVTEKSHIEFDYTNAEAALQIFNERSEIFKVVSTAPAVVETASSSPTIASSTDTIMTVSSDDLNEESESVEHVLLSQ